MYRKNVYNCIYVIYCKFIIIDVNKSLIRNSLLSIDQEQNIVRMLIIITCSVIIELCIKQVYNKIILFNSCNVLFWKKNCIGNCYKWLQ